MPKTIVLLDVDETCAVSNKSYGQHDGGYRYNEALLEALQACGLQEVYLFSSYNLGSIAKSKEEEKVGAPSRLKLITHLTQCGFTVQGAITSGDPIYNKGVGLYYEEMIKPYEGLVLEGNDIRKAPHTSGYQLAYRQEEVLREQAAKQNLTSKEALYNYAVNDLQRKFPQQTFTILVFDDRRILLEEIMRFHNAHFKIPLLCVEVKPLLSLMHYQEVIEDFFYENALRAIEQPPPLDLKRQEENKQQINLQTIAEDTYYQTLLKEINGILTVPFNPAEPTATVLGLRAPITIPLKLARDLLSQDEQGKPKNNPTQTGINRIVRIGDVFFKHGAVERPCTEQVVYQISRLLGEDLVAPTHMLFIQVQGELTPLQASLAVEGIGLDELIRIPGAVSCLKKLLGEEQLEQELSSLVKGNYYEAWLRKHPEAKALVTWEAQCDFFLNWVYQFPTDKWPKGLRESRQDKKLQERLKRKILQNSDAKEMAEADLQAAIEKELKEQDKKDMYSNTALRNKSLFHLLAFLDRFPQLLNQYLIDLIHLPYSFKLLNELYPNDTAKNLISKGIHILQRLDFKQLSLHFVLALLTQPQDHKGDNFRVRVIRELGGELTFKPVAIDNDMALEGTIYTTPTNEHIIQVKTVLFGLTSLLQTPLESTVVNKIKSLSLSNSTLQWLRSFLDYQARYKILLDKPLKEYLHLEAPLRSGFVQSVFRNLELVQKILSHSPNITHGQLLESIEPLLSRFYQYLSHIYPDAQSLVIALYDRSESKTTLIEETLEPILQEKLATGTTIATFLQTLQKKKNEYVESFKEAFSLIEQQAFLSPSRLLPENQKLQKETIELLLNNMNEVFCFPQIILTAEQFIFYCRRAPEAFISLLKEKVREVILEVGTETPKPFRVLLPSPKDLKIKGLPVLLEIMPVANAKELIEGLLRYGFSVSEARDIDGYTPLHFAARYNLYPLIPLLIEGGANLEALDKQNATALDKAIQYQHQESIYYLLLYGAGRHLQAKHAENIFNDYQKDSETLIKPCLVHRLLTLNPYLEWQLVINGLTQTAPTPEDLKVGGIEEIRYLKSHFVQEMYKNGDHFPAEGDYKSKVLKPLYLSVFPKKKIGIQLEYNPRFLSQYFIRTTLESLLFGTGETLGALWRFSKEDSMLWIKNTVSYPVLATRVAQGERLSEVLKAAPQKLGFVDKEYFSERFILDLLLQANEEEAEDYQLEPFYRGKKKYYRLIPIHTKQKLAELQNNSRQNILYSLTQVNEPLHPNVRKKLLVIEPYVFLMNWLNTLAQEHSKMQKLFIEKEHKMFAGQNLMVGINIKPNLVTALYKKWMLLRTVLQQHPEEISLRNLLGCVKLARVKPAVPLMAGKARLEEQQIFISDQTIVKQLTENHSQYLEFERLQKQVAQESLSAGGDLCLRLKRILEEQQINCLEINCQTMTLAKQKEYLDLLQTGSFVILKLSHCQVLTDEILSDILRKSPNLLVLRLQACSQLTLNVLNILEKACPLLEILEISAFPGQHLQIHNSLRILRIKDCKDLKTCGVDSPYLYELEVTNCTLLDTLTVMSKALQALKLLNCSLSHTYFYEQHPYLLNISLQGLPENFVLALHEAVSKVLYTLSVSPQLPSQTLKKQLQTWLSFWVGAIQDSELSKQFHNNSRISRLLGSLEFTKETIERLVKLLSTSLTNKEDKVKEGAIRLLGMLGALNKEKEILIFLEYLKIDNENVLLILQAVADWSLPTDSVIRIVFPEILKLFQDSEPALRRFSIFTLKKLMNTATPLVDNRLALKGKAYFNPLLSSCQFLLAMEKIEGETLEKFLPELLEYLYLNRTPLTSYARLYEVLSEEHREIFYTALIHSKHANELLKVKALLGGIPNSDGRCPKILEEKKEWQTLLKALVVPQEAALKTLPLCEVEGDTISKQYMHPDIIAVLVKEQWLIGTQQGAPAGSFNFFKKKELIKKTLSIIPERVEEKGKPKLRPSAATKQKEQAEQKAQHNAAQGNHLVVPIRHDRYRVHIKIRPDFPGMEIAFSLLLRRIMGEGSPSVELWRWSSGDINYPILISQTLDGETLNDTLLSQYPLELESFSRLVVMSFLVNPGDGNPGNFLAQKILDEQNRTVLRLVSIDNDRLFAPTFDGGHVRVATALYCFKEMLKPVDEKIRVRLLQLDALALLKAWLEDLKNLNAKHANIFKKDLSKYLDENLMDKQQSYVLSMLKEQTMREVYSKLKRIQHWLYYKPNISHLELLSKLHPSLANFYSDVIQLAQHPEPGKRKVYQSPLARFEYAVGNEYRREQVGAIKKYTSSMHMNQFMQMQGRELQGNKQIVEQWQEDFEKAEKELIDLSVNAESIEKARQESLIGNFKNFEELPTANAQESMIASIDFDKELALFPKEGCKLFCEVAEKLPEQLLPHHAPALILLPQQQFIFIIKDKEDIKKIAAPLELEPKMLYAHFKSRGEDNSLLLPWKHEIVQWLLTKTGHRLQPDETAQTRWWNGLLAVTKLKDLERITIRSSSALTDKQLQSLWSRLKNIRQLDIIDCPRLQTIVDFYSKKLVRLKLVNLTGITALNLNLPNLESLNVYQNPNLQTLYTKSDNLKKLNLSKNVVLQSLSITAPKLEEVDFSDCRLVTDTHLSELTRLCPNIKLMNLQGCQDDKILYRSIKELVPALAGVQWEKQQMQSLAALVEDLLTNKIEKLDVFEDFSPDKIFAGLAFQAIHLALLRNSSVTQINLSISFMTDEEVILLAKMLEKNSNIRDLMIFEKNVTDKGIVALANALANNASLGALCLGPNIGDDGLAALGKAIIKNHALYTVALVANTAGDKGAIAFAEGLQHNHNISTLMLMGNGIYDKGATELGKALQQQRSVQNFLMLGSSIGGAGAAAFGKALEVNPYLRLFGLASNSIDEGGCVELLDGLAKNSGVVGFGLLSKLGLNATKALARALTAPSVTKAELYLIAEENLPADLETCPVPALVYTKEKQPAFFVLQQQTSTINRPDLLLKVFQRKIVGITECYIHLISKKEMSGQSQSIPCPLIIYDDNNLPLTFILSEYDRTDLSKQNLEFLNRRIKEGKEKGIIFLDFDCLSKIGMSIAEYRNHTLGNVKECAALITENLQNEKQDASPVKLSLNREHPVIQILNKKHSYKLTGLALGASDMDYEQTEILAESFVKNKTVEVLALLANTIGPRRIQSLAKIIKSNTVLKELACIGSNIRDQEAILLAAALKNSNRKTLLEVQFSFNPIAFKGIQALQKANIANVRFGVKEPPELLKYCPLFFKTEKEFNELARKLQSCQTPMLVYGEKDLPLKLVITQKEKVEVMSIPKLMCTKLYEFGDEKRTLQKGISYNKHREKIDLSWESELVKDIISLTGHTISDQVILPSDSIRYEDEPPVVGFLLRHPSGMLSILPYILSFMTSSFIKFVMWLVRDKFNYKAKNENRQFLSNRHAFFARNAEEQEELLSNIPTGKFNALELCRTRVNSFSLNASAKLNHETSSSLPRLSVYATSADGNCAINAVALGICDLARADLATRRKFSALLRDCFLQKEDFAAWVMKERNPKEQETVLAPILRKLAVDCIVKSYEYRKSSYEYRKSSYESQLVNAFTQYRKDKSRDETFSVPDVMLKKFEDPKLTAEELVLWWNEMGKNLYFQNLAIAARNANDRDRWGSDIEIDALAFYFGIIIKNVGVHATQVLGKGYGFIPKSQLISPGDIEHLTALGIGEDYLHGFKIGVKTKEELTERLKMEFTLEEAAYLRAELKKGLDSQILKQINGQQVVSLQQKDLQSLCDKLLARGFLTIAAGGGYRFIAEKEMLCRLTPVSESLRKKVLEVHEEPLSFSICYEGAHWSYLGEIAQGVKGQERGRLARKANYPVTPAFEYFESRDRKDSKDEKETRKMKF
jgi:hypothetical protein